MKIRSLEILLMSRFMFLDNRQQDKDKNNTDITPKTKSKWAAYTPPKFGVDSGVPKERTVSASCRTQRMLFMSNLVWGKDTNGISNTKFTIISFSI